MSTIGLHHSRLDRRRAGRLRVVVWVLASGALVLQALALGQEGKARTFTTPEEAVKTLVDVARKGDLDGLLAIFGPDGRDLAGSSDPATARTNRQVFVVAVAERWRLEDAATANRKTLVIGDEEWPFPVPLVKDASGWRFDTAAGREEVIARRIGRNELATIETVRAYVAAQQRYAAQGHDGKPAGIHARRILSDPGTENGLYWPAAHGQKRSPLGELVAEAAEDGRATGGRSTPAPFHGYYFRILTGQGPAAAGGSRSYIVKGEMTGGFALVAWPAHYNETGIVSFLVNQDGVLHEKDLGPGTDAAARKMTRYNPDASWRRVDE